ncbi:GTP pyrophosphokinase family protein [Clostridium sp. AM29-11AC]|uniref:GTP pyrophosphokinase n=1 Tax=Clostridium sp. AM29-11AC TaxID=2293028 RepID=UPI000E4F23AC|nr:GTP pyrophosphokinase family protein [Clostridium sp. AM29-11AC]RHT56117.1 GTP pyrophosphokinase family protein [Clostridium sp. AM29-11AC]
MEISYEAKLADRAEALKDFFGGDDKEATSVEKLELLDQFESLMIKYRAAVREVTTKLEVLNDELSSFAERNPIEGIQSRIKRPYSIAKKLKARGLPVAVESIQKNLNDVAGIRVICPFISDIYDVADMLLSQEDVLLIEKKDYIEKPKDNGYRSLHLIVEIPIFLSKGKENMRVEIQIRTVAMDFWASLEHQIRYKKGLEEGQKISEGLKECADTIARTDLRMQELREMIKSSV